MISFDGFERRILTDNLMVRIKADGLFRDLPNLIKADLRRNKIAVIDNGAFEGASTLLELYVFYDPERS